MNKPKIGITIGDVNGIGPEIIIKALSHESITNLFTPIIYGSSKVMAYHKNIVEDHSFVFSNISGPERAVQNKVNIINCWDENVNITLSKATEEGGKYAFLSLEKATFDLNNGMIDAMVTAPINKQAMKMHGFEDIGHTEYISKVVGGKSLMTMCSDSMKVALVTNHLPLKEVSEKITTELITEKLNIFYASLQQDFGLEKPVVAILGLNPHAGDEGTIGNEEQDIIRPVIINAKKSGMTVMGPYPADGFFGSSQFTKVDGILAMYHDQGLVPFKAISFGSGINFTAGLNVIRTSPDHGTAYDIAGRNIANASSMRKAIFLALDVVHNRKRYAEDRENALVKNRSQNE